MIRKQTSPDQPSLNKSGKSIVHKRDEKQLLLLQNTKCTAIPKGIKSSRSKSDCCTFLLLSLAVDDANDDSSTHSWRLIPGGQFLQIRLTFQLHNIKDFNNVSCGLKTTADQVNCHLHSSTPTTRRRKTISRSQGTQTCHVISPPISFTPPSHHLSANTPSRSQNGSNRILNMKF